MWAFSSGISEEGTQIGDELGTVECSDSLIVKLAAHALSHRAPDKLVTAIHRGRSANDKSWSGDPL